MDHFTEVMLGQMELIYGSISNYVYILTSVIYVSGYLHYKAKKWAIKILASISSLSGIAAVIICAHVYRDSFEYLNRLSIYNKPDFDESIRSFYCVYWLGVISVAFLVVSYLGYCHGEDHE